MVPDPPATLPAIHAPVVVVPEEVQAIISVRAVVVNDPVIKADELGPSDPKSDVFSTPVSPP